METKTIEERAAAKMEGVSTIYYPDQVVPLLIEFAEEVKAIDIEKAIGWIRGHVDAVTWHGGKDDETFIDAFRRALEE